MKISCVFVTTFSFKVRLILQVLVLRNWRRRIWYDMLWSKDRLRHKPVSHRSRSYFFWIPLRSMNSAFKTSTCVLKNSRFKSFREKQHFIVLKNTFLCHSPGMSDKRLAWQEWRHFRLISFPLVKLLDRINCFSVAVHCFFSLILEPVVLR